jgi:VanZ like family
MGSFTGRDRVSPAPRRCHRECGSRMRICRDVLCRVEHPLQGCRPRPLTRAWCLALPLRRKRIADQTSSIDTCSIDRIPYSPRIDHKVLAPARWEGMRSLGRFTLAGAALSLLIETLQVALNLGRQPSLTDVIPNTAGPALGYLLFLVLRRRIRERSRIRVDNSS